MQSTSHAYGLVTDTLTCDICGEVGNAEVPENIEGWERVSEYDFDWCADCYAEREEDNSLVADKARAELMEVWV